MRVISWNVLRLIEATAMDLAALIDSQRPDLLLLQEATADIDRLPSLIGGHYWRRSMPNRIHGLAFWSPRRNPEPTVISLPFDPLSRSGDQRIAAALQVNDASLANVHLAHGQFLLRKQLRHIADNVVGRVAIVGDMNAIGSTSLTGFRDIGPQKRTHMTKGILPVRIDRCLARGIACSRAAVLDRGRSDHHPILVDLDCWRWRQSRTSADRGTIGRAIGRT
jgi:endonuclease/exonuclease/phosphatase (EEP) superfamily protein YafD